MASYLKSFNPIPGFPEYTGPYKVGTIEVEIPVSQLNSPSPAPEESIDTVLFRIFYPCQDDTTASKSITWLPSPQREQVSAYARFLGAGSRAAAAISFVPRLLHYISIPVMKNAPLLSPDTRSERWPVMIFSHGLAGNRNAYSHLAGSVASHGVVVVTPEHRDGSCPITYIRDVRASTSTTRFAGFMARKSKRTIDYHRMPHKPSPEVEAGRTAQLKIRLWELGCIHDAILKIDEGVCLTNLNSFATPLSNFSKNMAVHEPGSIIFAGHSFGAASVTQFVKSTFYSPENATAPAKYQPIFTPSPESSIVKQITPETTVILLDIWCMPLRASSTRWLWNKPMPCYAPGGPGGSALLAVESETFFKWRVHLRATKALLSADPRSEAENVRDDRPPPQFFYVTMSAHLSQSDFGILFPWVTKKMFGSEEPHRAMTLNVRAILQLLRERKFEVAPPSAVDLELQDGAEISNDDKEIFAANTNEAKGIRGWNRLTTDMIDLNDVDYDEDTKEDDSADSSDVDLKEDALDSMSEIPESV